MLRLIVDNPGEWQPKTLAEQLNVSKRSIYQYLSTLTSAGIMVDSKDGGCTLRDEYWLNFLIKHRDGTQQPKGALVKLLTAAVEVVEDEGLCEQGRKFLALLDVENVE